MDNRVKRYLRPIAGFKTNLIWTVKSNVLYYVYKILRLKSEAKITDVEDIIKCRRKDTVFILGSGYSINDITREEWRHFGNIGDTISFNYFFKGKFIPINYHLCGEISDAPPYGLILLSSKQRKRIDAYYKELFENSCYKNTIYFLRYKMSFTKAPVPTALWALFFLKAFKNKQVCLFKIIVNLCKSLEPSNEIYSIYHNGATLFDAVNICYILGYKKMVLVGIDLYDRRYFWLDRNETHNGDLNRDKTYSDIHATADNVLSGVALWNKYLIKKGVKLYIYNPRSLLNKMLPVYRITNNESGPKK